MKTRSCTRNGRTIWNSCRDLGAAPSCGKNCEVDVGGGRTKVLSLSSVVAVGSW